MECKRGQVWYCNLDGIKGSEQGGVRPVLIISNDIGNKHAPVVTIAIITSKHTKAKLPTHIWLSTYCGLTVNSLVELEQVRTVDKSRLLQYLGEIQKGEQRLVDEAIKISFGVN